MKLTKKQLRSLILEQLSSMAGPGSAQGGFDPEDVNWDTNNDGRLDNDELRRQQDARNKEKLRKHKVHDSKTEVDGKEKLLKTLDYISIIDPTGISSWPGLADAIDKYEKNPNEANSISLYISAVGVIPLLGKGKIFLKILTSLRNLGKPAKVTLQSIKGLAKSVPKQSGRITDLLKKDDIQKLASNKELRQTLINNKIDPDALIKVLKKLITLDHKIDLHTVLRKGLFYLGNAVDHVIEQAIDTATFDNMVDFAKYVGKKGYNALSALVKEENSILVNRKTLEHIIRESIEDRLNPNQSKLHNASVGGIPIKMQIVDDEAGRKKGLMYRQNMPKDEGMLFIHDAPDMCGYYMKNTFIPLSIAYADEEGTIFQIEDMNPGDLNSVMSIQPALYALEMNQGWFDDNGIVIGNIIEF